MAGKSVVPAVEEPKALSTEEQFAQDVLLQGLGTGMEDVDKKDYALPFLKILQAQSPEVTRGNEKFIDKASAGDFCDSSNGTIVPGEPGKGIDVIRLKVEKKWIEWNALKAGGGFVAISDTETEAQNKRRPFKDPVKGFDKDVDSDVVETAQVYLLYRPATGGSWSPALLPLTKSKLKMYKDWNALIAQQTARKYFGAKAPSDRALRPEYVIYRLTTAPKKFPAGTAFVPKVGVVGMIDQATHDSVAEFMKLIAEGRVTVDVEANVDAEIAEDIPGIDDEAQGY